jgi:hypothetical protein
VEIIYGEINQEAPRKRGPDRPPGTTKAAMRAKRLEGRAPNGQLRQA